MPTSYVVEAIYEGGVLKPDRPLPLKEHEKVQVTVEGPAAAGHSTLDIRPVSLGQVLRPPSPDDDLLYWAKCSKAGHDPRPRQRLPRGGRRWQFGWKGRTIIVCGKPKLEH